MSAPDKPRAAGGRIVFMGTPALAAPSLLALARAGFEVSLAITQPDRPAGRGKKLARCPVAAVADDLGIPVSQPARVAQALEEIAKAEPDALAVVAYGQLLPPELLALPPKGAVNLHASLLPLLRGAAPINWAIIHGQRESGVSTMFMDAGLDTGDVIETLVIPLDLQETAATLGQKVAEQGAGLLVHTLGLVMAGQAPRTPQAHAKATWAPLLSKRDGLVDWSLSAGEISGRVRGLDPWPGAYTIFEGQPLKLFAPLGVLDLAHASAPGTVLPPPPLAAGQLVVATGQGALAFSQVQAPGKKRMAAEDFLRGSRLSEGDVLG